MDSTARSHLFQKKFSLSLLGLGFGVFKAKNLEIKMASVGVVDDDRSGGQEKWAFYPKELGWGSRRTRSSKGKEKHIKDDAYYHPGIIIKANLDTWAFDVDDDYVPFALPPEVIGPIDVYAKPNFEKDRRLLEEVQLCSSKAIDVYNNKHNAEYHFVKVNKLAYKLFQYYVTFEAVVERKDAAPVYSQFQAIVFARPGDTKDDMEVFLCRLKPNA